MGESLGGFRILTWVLMLLCVGGCGGSGIEMGSISGTVSLDNLPIKEAVVQFVTPGNRAARGRIVDGQIVDVTTYAKNDGAPVGSHKVVILEAYRDVPKEMKPGAQMVIKPVTKLPTKYSNLADSPLTAEIKSGENQLEFALKSK